MRHILNFEKKFLGQYRNIRFLYTRRFIHINNLLGNKGPVNNLTNRRLHIIIGSA